MKILLRGFVVVAILVMSAASVSNQGQQTIPEKVAAGITQTTISPGSGRVGGVPDGFSKADLFVKGTLGNPRTALSEDQLNVVTRYPLTNVTILYSRLPLVSSRPGLPNFDVVITQVGGTVNVSGKLFTLVNGDAIRFEAGKEGLFLLRRTDDGYAISGGAYAIEAGRLTPFPSGGAFAANEYQGQVPEEAIKQILARLQNINR